MFARILAGIIMCFIGFNAATLNFFSLEAFTKASIASVVIGSIIGYLSYKGKTTEDKEQKVTVKRSAKKKAKRRSFK